MDMLDFAMKYEDSASHLKRMIAKAAATLCRWQANRIGRRLQRIDIGILEYPEMKERMRNKILAEVKNSHKTIYTDDGEIK